LTKPNLQSPTTTLSVRVHLQRMGMEMRLLIEGEHAREPNTGLIKLLLKARVYAEQLASGSAQSLEDIATREQSHPLLRDARATGCLRRA
jgi:hypothetical protein